MFVALDATIQVATMILKFAHKGLERFYATGSKAGINPQHADKLSRQLSFLDNATKPQDVDVIGWKLHPLTGDLMGYYSISVNGNWRLIFKFSNENVEIVDYLDYH